MSGSTSFAALHWHTVDHKLQVKGQLVITSRHIELVSLDSFGQLKSGYLKISAPIIPGVLGYDASYNHFGQMIQLRDFSDKHILGSMHFDVPSERQSLRAVYCIMLYSGLGLAIIPVNMDKGVYQRIGHIQSLESKYFEEVKFSDFILV